MDRSGPTWTSSTVRTCCSAPVLATITSAAPIASTSRSNATATAPIRSARLRAARSADRLRHEEVGTTGTMQCDRDALTHRSGTDDEHPLALQVADDIGDHLDGRVAHRRRAPADAGLGAGTLAGLDRAAEQQVQRRPGGTLELGDLPGACVPDRGSRSRRGPPSRARRRPRRGARRRWHRAGCTGAGSVRRPTGHRVRRGSRARRRTPRGTAR